MHPAGLNSSITRPKSVRDGDEFMKMLSENQVEAIIALGKVLPDNKLTAILDELQNEQPLVYHLIYGEPSDAIALLNRDMANLYLDLSFDVGKYSAALHRKCPWGALPNIYSPSFL
ncbi:MAG: hypothetical protein BA867_06065 [Desulfobacterales bacterium S5133MH16]|nr:MAG: hypothetical protein BA867_06065 [Desulfobacterales bacterium S5133MH16]